MYAKNVELKSKLMEPKAKKRAKSEIRIMFLKRNIRISDEAEKNIRRIMQY